VRVFGLIAHRRSARGESKAPVGKVEVIGAPPPREKKCGETLRDGEGDLNKILREVAQVARCGLEIRGKCRLNLKRKQSE